MSRRQYKTINRRLHKPIIDNKTWDLVQEKRKQNAPKVKHRNSIQWLENYKVDYEMKYNSNTENILKYKLFKKLRYLS